MRRVVAFLLAFLALGSSGISVARAGVRSFHDLSVTEKLALQDSEQRLVLFDRALLELKPALKHHQISRQEFVYEERDLTACIAAEAKYQNDILTKDSGFAEDAREVAQNIAKYTTYVVGGILYLAVRCAPGFSGISP